MGTFEKLEKTIEYWFYLLNNLFTFKYLYLKHEQKSVDTLVALWGCT